MDCSCLVVLAIVTFFIPGDVGAILVNTVSLLVTWLAFERLA